MNTGGGSLLDLVATLLAFVALILLLSLVVTALVQWIQSALRLRGRNLRSGLQLLLRTAILQADQPIGNATPGTAPTAGTAAAPAATVDVSLPPVPTTAHSDARARDLADRIVANEELLPLRQVTAPPRLSNFFFGPPRSWLKKEELLDILRTKESQISPAGIALADRLFERWEALLTKRYQFSIRKVTVICALLVSGVFQVNAPRVLRDLSTNPEMREKYLGMAEELRDKAETSLARLTPYQDVSDQALRNVQARYPDRASQLEEVSGVASNKGALLAEIIVVLPDDAQRGELVRAYSDELDRLEREANEDVREELYKGIGGLARIDVHPWGRGLSFYVSGTVLHWNNILGVLVTAILLTFGAPFWFKQLQELAKLRDALAPKKAESQAKATP